MTTSLVCYAQPEKCKSQKVLEAFAAGCGARMAWTTARYLEPGVPVFYGVRPAWHRLWEQAKWEDRSWIFIDNSYFDGTREKQFRATWNAIQHAGFGKTDGLRFRSMDLMIRPPRSGSIVVACAQSAEFMKTVAGDDEWLTREVEYQRKLGHQVLVRHKGEKRPLQEDLERARLVVTWSSAAAVGAILNGVPVLCSPECCASGVKMDDRERWAGVLADNQWTLDEFARGFAWRKMNA